MYETFNDDKDLFLGGTYDIFVDGFALVQSLAERIFQDAPEYWEKIGVAKPKPKKDEEVGKPYDIRILVALFALVYALLSLIIDGLPLLVMSCIKFVPGLVAVLIYSWKRTYVSLKEKHILLFVAVIPFYLLLHPLFFIFCLVGNVIYTALAIVGSYMYIVYAVYKYGVLVASKEMLCIWYYADSYSNQMLFGKDFSIFACFKNLSGGYTLVVKSKTIKEITNIVKPDEEEKPSDHHTDENHSA